MKIRRAWGIWLTSACTRLCLDFAPRVLSSLWSIHSSCSVCWSRSRDSELCRLVAWQVQFCRISLSRGSDLSHLRHWTWGRGTILRGESLHRRLREAGRIQEFGSPGNSAGQCRYSRYRSSSLSSSVIRPPSRNCLGVQRLFRAVSLGEWESCMACACGSLRFVVSRRARASPACAVTPEWWVQRHVGLGKCVRAGTWTGPHVETRVELPN